MSIAMRLMLPPISIAGKKPRCARSLDSTMCPSKTERAEFVELVRLISEGEHVCVLCGGSEPMESAKLAMKDIKQVELFDIPTNDAWIRDFGPTFVRDVELGELTGIDWNYDCWGEKYPPFDQDQKVAARLCSTMEIGYHKSQITVEGGAIEINGIGEMLHTNCLLIRNSHCDRQQIENTFNELLGSQHHFWLPSAELAGDDTDGHIDQFARFVDDNTVGVAFDSENRQSSINHNRVALEQQAIKRGRTINIVELPTPLSKTVHGRAIPASYLNFYICNLGIVVPQFHDPADAIAIEQLSNCFSRPIIPLSSLNLSVGLGSFHCLTQQEPLI